MAKVSQCDNCRTLGDFDAKEWFELFQVAPEKKESLFGVHVVSNVVGLFCSLKCVAEYATGRVLIESSKNE